MALKNFMAARGEQVRDDDSETARRPAASERPPRTVAPSTSIDSTSIVEGTLQCKNVLRIDGRVKGEIQCEKTVLIGEGAKVRANIVADAVQVSGEVEGDITARSKITLERTARVTGDLITTGIVIEEGAALSGRIVIGQQEKTEARTDVKTEAKTVEPPRPKAKPSVGKPTHSQPSATA